jgi:hypothetical protein
MRRAALLLEVVIALAVLVTAMGLMAAQLAGGLNMTTYSEEQLRASLLADRIVNLVQLDPQMQQLVAETETVEEKFGDDYPGYFWRVTTEPVDREKPDDLKLVTIEVFYQPDLQRQDSVSGLSDAKMLRKVGLLKAKRGALDLVDQAGLTEDQAEQLRQTIPIAGFDPRAVDLQQLIAMLDSDTIAQLLPMLMPLLQQIAAGGIPADLAGLADELGGALGVEIGGGSPEDLAGAIKDAVGAQGQPPGGAKPPVKPPGMAGRPPAGGPTRPPVPSKPPTPPADGGGQIDIGKGSGPNGEYTLEDLIRLRDEYERQQQAGGQ